MLSAGYQAIMHTCFIHWFVTLYSSFHHLFIRMFCRVMWKNMLSGIYLMAFGLIFNLLMHVYQDDDTANAIGSKSYNALMGELVALETWNMESECKNTPEEDCIDFAAATTATLGVPSPCLSKTRSFDESPHSASDERKARKGDLEEEAELIMALKMSEGELTTTVGDPLGATTDNAPPLVGSDGSTHPENVMRVDSVDKTEEHTAEHNNIHLSDLSVPEDCNASRNESINLISFDTTPGQTACSSPLETNKAENIDQPTYLKSQEHLSNDLVAKSTTNESVQIESGISFFPGRDTESLDENHTDVSQGDEKFESQAKLTTDAHGSLDKQNGSNMAEASCLSAPNVGLDSSSGRVQQTDALETLTSSDGEPIYEGEERILDSGTTVLQDKEPVYEGEVVLANQADKSPLDARSKGEITPQQGESCKISEGRNDYLWILSSFLCNLLPCMHSVNVFNILI